MSILRRFELTVRRADSAGQQYVNGLPVSGTITSFTITASIQPASPHDMQSLPEGRRSGKAFKLYTDTQLKTADDNTQQNADVVEYEGFDHDVIMVENWQNQLINHYKTMIVRVDAD